jgi:hypothetical protein
LSKKIIMRKIYFFICIFIGFSINSNAQAPFTQGNLVVYKIGDGTNALTNGAFPINLDEYTTGGTFVQSHPLPIAVSGANKRIVASGTSTSEGLLTLSTDGRFLLATGFDTLPSPTRTGGIAASLSATVNRVIGIVDATGTVDATTALSDAYSASDIRSAVSTNGTDIWVGGTGTPSSSAGVRYTTKGSTTSLELSTTVTNIRQVNIYNGQLYCTSASGAFQGLSSVGTGLPTTTGQTIAILPGFPTAAGPSPYAFSINTAGTIAYVADASSHTAGGGVQKWTLNAGTWTKAYTLDSGITSGVNDLTVDWSGANPIIYAVTSQSSLNRIISLADTGDSTVMFTILATADADYIFRGIAFAPQTNPVPVTLTSFTAALVSGKVKLQWATSQEINSKQFVVEKSTDRINFVSIGQVAAAANSNTTHNYQLVDATPADGVNYYRLKTVDIDGKFTYSNIEVVKYAVKNISVYPNPATTQIVVQHPTSNNGILLITDAQGMEIKTVSADLSSSSTINISNLAEGKYFVKFSDGNYNLVAAFNKL